MPLTPTPPVRHTPSCNPANPVFVNSPTRAPGRGFRRAPASAAAARWPSAPPALTCCWRTSRRDAVLADSGSEDIGSVIHCARPAFAFFGHYHRTGRRVEGDFGSTGVYHLSHLE